MSSSKMGRTRFSHKNVNTTIAIIASIFLAGIILVQPLRFSNDNGNQKIASVFAQDRKEEIIPLASHQSKYT